MSDLVRSAYQLAELAHRGQVRKYTKEPYVRHLVNVAYTVRLTGAPQWVVAAAVLHDTLEDTAVREEELLLFFGEHVTKVVVALTDCPKEVGNRVKRKALDRERLANVALDAIMGYGIKYWSHTIKYADILDNDADIRAHDPDFFRVWGREKAELLDVMTGGDQDLRARCLALVGPP